MATEVNELVESKSQVQKLYKKLAEHERYIAYLQGKVAHADKTTLEHRLEAEKYRQENTVLQVRLKELESENATLCNQIAQNRDIIAKCGEIASRLERDNEKRRKNNRAATERSRKRKLRQAELAQQGIEQRPSKQDPFGFNRLIWSQSNDEREQKHFGPSTISQLPSALLPTPNIPPLIPQKFQDQRGQYHYSPSSNSNHSTALLPTPNISPLLPVPQIFLHPEASSSTSVMEKSPQKDTRITRSQSPTMVELIY